MPVIDVAKDIDNRKLTITAEFAAPVERVWQVYADARQLEQIWGPPQCPSTFVQHSLTPGARSHYRMAGPEGQAFHGFWEIKTVEEPHRFTFDDGFADENYEAAPDMPLSHNVFEFSPSEKGTRLVASTTYDSAEALQQVLDMGAVEGATAAINQVDDLLARAA